MDSGMINNACVNMSHDLSGQVWGGWARRVHGLGAKSKRLVHVIMVWLILLFVLQGCGNNAISPEDDTLSQVMSLSNLSKSPIQNADGAVVGLAISVDVINTGPVPIDRAFVMTWTLRDDKAIATATHRFAGQPFKPAERRRVNLTVLFAARSSLTGVQDAVTFVFE